MTATVRFSIDAAEAWDAVGPYLESDPVRHNVLCTLLAQRATSATPIRCWWVDDGGVVFQAPDTFPAVLSVLAPRAVEPLARVIAADAAPPLPGASGLAADIAAFAGAHATAARRGATPVEGQRIYEVRAVVPPTDVPGAMRLAVDADVDLLASWLLGFNRDTGDGGPEPDTRARAATFVDAARYWIWEVDGTPVSSALTAPPAAGVVRIGGVYTPPERRGHGYAAAITAAMSADVLDAGDRCILYTQLQNPTSNAVYQRIGYEPVAEVVRYRFDR